MKRLFKKNEVFDLPEWWSKADIVNPPCFGEISLYLDENGNPCHPMYLWKAAIFDRVFFVYRQDWEGYRKRNYRGAYCHGFRIDFDSESRTSYPNRSQFESALFRYQDAAMDHNLLVEQKGSAA